MSQPNRQLPALPDSWSPEQALAAFELIDLIRDQLWAAYGPDIQRALRDDQQQPELLRSVKVFKLLVCHLGNRFVGVFVEPVQGNMPPDESSFHKPLNNDSDSLAC
jgi:hypothetical protein